MLPIRSPFVSVTYCSPPLGDQAGRENLVKTGEGLNTLATQSHSGLRRSGAARAHDSNGMAHALAHPKELRRPISFISQGGL